LFEKKTAAVFETAAACCLWSYFWRSSLAAQETAQQTATGGALAHPGSRPDQNPVGQTRKGQAL
jgi:hypothetical protein